MSNSPFIFGANGATSLVPGGVTLPASTSGNLQIEPASSTTSYALKMPGAQGGSNTIMSNDGSGNLSWVTGLPAVGSDGQIMKSMNSGYIQSSYYVPNVNYIGNAFAEVNTNGWSTRNWQQTVTITIASPAVFTVSSTTGFYVGMPISFSTTGALPTGLTSGTTYYVFSVDSSTTFKVSSSLGGTVLNTSGTQSGTHTSYPLVPINNSSVSFSGLTFSRNTSSPIRGSADFKLVQTNSTIVAGQALAYAITIDPADQAKVFSIQLDFNASSTFVASSGQTGSDSDLEVALWDVTNSLLIPVSPKVLTANGSNNWTFKGTCQTSSNSTSYALMIYTPTMNSNATGWTFKFTNVYVGPQTIVQGPPVTDFTSYSPTVNAGTFSSLVGQYRRVGDSLELNIIGTYTSGASGLFVFNLPSGLQIDTTKATLWAGIPNGSSSSQGNITTFGTILGTGFFTNGSNVAIGNVWNAVATSSSGISLFSEISSTGGMTADSSRFFTYDSGLGSGHSSLASGSKIVISAKIPILGWSSNTLMSNDANTRVVATEVQSTGTISCTANTAINFPTVNYDLTGSYSSGVFTCPVSGVYEVGVNGLFYSTTTYVQVWKNGSFFAVLTNIASTTQVFNGILQVQCKSGDQLIIIPTVSGSLTSAGGAYFPIAFFKMISGPSAIAATDSINARYYASSTSISGSLTTIAWTTKDYDSTNSMNLSSSGVYTIPVSGKYTVKAQLALSGTFVLNNTTIIEIQKNGTATKDKTQYIAAAITNDSITIEDDVNCLPGDLIRIQVSNSGTSPAIVSSNTRNVFSIFRSGN